ncbi:MAG: hypothetical protein E7615_07365 [Ruminococcaceae bacterium]|nr:hypothetical protein [Oscillospiraceae bacterium]
MFGFIKRLTKPRNENSLRFKQEMADRMNGKHIKYVTERENDSDIVIGHDGCIAVRNGELILLSDGVVKFRVNVADMTASELMSLEGVILSGPDLENGSIYRTVIAYYKYYR